MLRFFSQTPADGANEGWIDRRGEKPCISLTAMMECTADPPHTTHRHTSTCTRQACLISFPLSLTFSLSPPLHHPSICSDSAVSHCLTSCSRSSTSLPASQSRKFSSHPGNIRFPCRILFTFSLSYFFNLSALTSLFFHISHLYPLLLFNSHSLFTSCVL